ncbi:MAG: hypothetical protein K9G76_00475 [Bacteroidales bacterium]|nr:hypothetical protein [Bacteroidales bacterium]MCF8402586.1 hypothetical protein [Bacteroidales bacterium]
MKRHATFYQSCFLAGLIFILFAQSALGQDKLTLDPGADLVSRYIWRGADFGNSPAIQPYMELGCGGFAFGAWGSYATNDANFQEADLYASYTFNDIFTVLVTDYFFPDASVANNKYFQYDYNNTGHVFEGAVSFNGTEKIPVSLLVATNFAGADARTVDNTLQYSTYFELGYSAAINETNLDFFLGGTPTKPDSDKGESGFYGPHEGIINIGIKAEKEVQITEKFALPVNVSVITNPQQQNIFFVLGISL